MAFAKNVFINCPFDDGYRRLLRPLLFTIVYLGFEPRIALEQLDSGKPRIEKILEIVRKSKYALHDLSRSQAKAKGEFFRLNMPFELGLDVGCHSYGTGQCRTKKCLILESKKYRHQATLSDLSNSDLAIHKNSPELLVRELRNWFESGADLNTPGAAKVWSSFEDFMAWNYVELKSRHYSDNDIKKLPVPDFVKCAKKWCQANPW